MIRLTLYGKARCPLCEDAFEVVEEVRRSLAGQVITQLEVVDITSDAALLARYRHEVPVLAVDGRDAFRHRVDAERLRLRLLGKRPGPLEEA